MLPPLSSPSSCLIWGLSTMSVTQYKRPCSLMALTEPGLTRRDRLSHVAGDAPLACCLSLHLTAVSWMQSDKGLRRRCECLFLSMTQDAMFKNTKVVTVAQASLFYPLVSSCICDLLCRGGVGTPAALWVFHHCTFCPFVL